MAGQPTLAVHISLTLKPKSVYSNLAEELLEHGTSFAYMFRSISVWYNGFDTILDRYFTSQSGVGNLRSFESFGKRRIGEIVEAVGSNVNIYKALRETFSQPLAYL